jgi:hypothetical protein
MKNVTVPLLLPFLLSCSAEAKPEKELEIQEVPELEPQIASLKIASTVDLSHEQDSTAVVPLHRFFERKLYPTEDQDFWLHSDMERYAQPYEQIRYIEYDSKGELKWRPTLIRIKSIDKGNDRLLTVRWARTDSTGTPADVRYVFEFISTETLAGYKLALPIDHITRHWTCISKGSVNYIVSPEHQFSDSIASYQQEQIDFLADFFEIPAFPITFYSCADPADLFRAQGFKYHPLMYVHETGGMVDHGNNVWSGNDRDEYTHEIVHVFTGRKFPERQNLMDEGLATLLGGSSGRPYEHHRAVLRRLLASDPEFDMRDHLLTTVQEHVEEHTNLPYVIGGLICEYLLQHHGKDGLFDVMSSGEDPWPALSERGLIKENMNEVLQAQITRDIPRLFNEE